MADGRVVLVGAGPGDPELITVRGLGWLRRAEVVVYDHLVSPALLDEAPVPALRIFAGKLPGRHCLPQEAIHGLLIHHALAGRLVVRLRAATPTTPQLTNTTAPCNLGPLPCRSRARRLRPGSSTWTP